MHGRTLKILEYDVRQDAHGYHARYTGHLPPAALAAGVVREIHAPDPLTLLHAAVRNRISAWAADPHPGRHP